MINFGNIHIIGYCSIPELRLDLNKPGITIIRGENGFGKSKIFSSLIWGLYGKNLNGVSNVNTWKERQPKDYQGTLVEVYFTVDSDTYKVSRCQEYKGDLQGAPGNNRLVLLKNGNEISTKGKNQIQDEIVKSLGMSYELFINSIVFGQNMARLINEPNSSKREVFEQIFSMGFIEKAKEYSKEKYKKYREIDFDLYGKMKNLYDRIQSEEEHIQNQLDNQRAFEDIRKSQIKGIKNRIQGLKDDLNKFETRYKEIPGNTISKNNGLQDKLSKVDKKLDTVNEVIGNLSLADFIDTLWNLCIKGKFSRLKKTLKDYKELYKEQYNLTQKLNDIRNEMSELRDNVILTNSLIRGIDSTRKTLENTEKELIKARKQKRPESLNKPNHLKEYQKKLNDLKEEYHLNKKKLNNYEWLLQDPLGTSGIKAYLFQNALTLVNQYLSEYADILGFSINITVNMESARKDFITTIERDGIEMDYKELSGGQQQLVNLSMAFAMNGVLSSSKGINVILLDEIFESLSENNIDVVISLLKTQYKDKSIYMITHLSNLPISGNIIQVGYKNGLSNYTTL